MALRRLDSPPKELGGTSSPGRPSSAPSVRPPFRPPLVDVRVHWFGSTRSIRAALSSLAFRDPEQARGSGTSITIAEVSAAQPVEAYVANVEPTRAVHWALGHLLEADVSGPAWLCGWIADELARRAVDYGQRPGCHG